MKKFILILILLAFPATSFASNNMDKTITEFSQKMEKQSKQELDNAMSSSNKSLSQEFEDFKNDPMGKTNQYYNDAKIFFREMLDTTQKAIDELKN